jgi:ABC-2 type transport system ATP-binding protein
VLLNDGHVSLAEVVRALDQERLQVENIQLHQASLDDVFLAKTGRSLEGAGDEEDEEPEAGLALESA